MAGSGILLKNAIVWGLRRSAFSNEAGLGSAPIAHAAANCEGPVQQGIFGIFEVFVDTILICSLTALSIIISGVDVTFGEKPGSELITSAFSTIFGTKASALFIAFALMMFAYSTILGWSLVRNALRSVPLRHESSPSVSDLFLHHHRCRLRQSDRRGMGYRRPPSTV